MTTEYEATAGREPGLQPSLGRPLFDAWCADHEALGMHPLVAARFIVEHAFDHGLDPRLVAYAAHLLAVPR